MTVVQTLKQCAAKSLVTRCLSEVDHYAAWFEEGDRFWQPKYYSFEIYGRQKLEEKLRYMHLNPERAGLVERAVDWRWSSARWYEWGRSVGVPIRWVDCD